MFRFVLPFPMSPVSFPVRVVLKPDNYIFKFGEYFEPERRGKSVESPSRTYNMQPKLLFSRQSAAPGGLSIINPTFRPRSLMLNCLSPPPSILPA
jgi:hypothetical protein